MGVVKEGGLELLRCPPPSPLGLSHSACVALTKPISSGKPCPRPRLLVLQVSADPVSARCGVVRPRGGNGRQGRLIESNFYVVFFCSPLPVPTCFKAVDAIRRGERLAHPEEKARLRSCVFSSASAPPSSSIECDRLMVTYQSSTRIHIQDHPRSFELCSGDTTFVRSGPLSSLSPLTDLLSLAYFPAWCRECFTTASMSLLDWISSSRLECQSTPDACSLNPVCV